MKSEQEELREISEEIKLLKKDIIQFDKDLFAVWEREKVIKEMVAGFNPETHIIVTKSQLDITNELKSFAGMFNKIEILDDVSKKVTEVHARLTNNVQSVIKEKPLTKKQRENLEIEMARKQAHERIRLNGYKR